MLTKTEEHPTTRTQLAYKLGDDVSVWYKQLEEYAISIDISLVAIRLERARKAAQNQNEKAFARLAQDILSTLDERFQKVSTIRNSMTLPKFNNQVDARAMKSVTASGTDESQNAE